MEPDGIVRRKRKFFPALESSSSPNDSSNGSDQYDDLESTSDDCSDDNEKMKEPELRETAADARKTPSPPIRVIFDDELYCRRKTVGNHEYYYCVRHSKGCRAGFVRNCDTGCCKRNKHPHTHEGDVEQQVSHENEAEISFRLFIQEHIHMDSRDIYSLILKDDFEAQHNYEFFPTIQSIDIKRIQNTKALLGGSLAANVLQSLLHPSLAELNGARFLAMQSVRPPILLFATKEQLDRLCRAGTCMVKRLRISGKVIQFVYCVYAVSTTQVVPTAWILSSERNNFLWSQFKLFLSSCKEGAQGIARKFWLVPCGRSYVHVAANLVSQTTRDAAGIRLSYVRKVEKIIARVLDPEVHDALKELFLSMRTEKIHMIHSKASEAERDCQSIEAKQAIHYWRTIYENQFFMYHHDATLENAHVDRVYADVKQTPERSFDTDAELISFIHTLAE